MAVSKARSVAGANARAVAEVREKTAAARSKSSGDDDDDWGDDDDDDTGGSGGDEVELSRGSDDSGDVEVGGDPEPTPRERRRAERRSMREENEELRRRDEERQREIAALRQQITQRQEPTRQEPTAPERDATDLELRNVELEYQQLNDRWANMDQAQRQANQQTMYDRQQELRARYEDLRVEKALKKRGIGGQDPSQSEHQVRNEFLRQQYPEVANHRVAWSWACSMSNAEAEAAATEKGRPLTQAEVDAINHRVLQGARTRFQLQGARQPTEQTRSRYAGAPQGGNGAPRPSADGAAKQTLTLKKGSEQYKMAMRMAKSAFPHIARKKGDDACLKHWAKVAGPGVVKEFSKQRA